MSVKYEHRLTITCDDIECTSAIKSSSDMKIDIEDVLMENGWVVAKVYLLQSTVPHNLYICPRHIYKRSSK